MTILFADLANLNSVNDKLFQSVVGSLFQMAGMSTRSPATTVLTCGGPWLAPHTLAGFRGLELRADDLKLVAKPCTQKPTS